ncbi:MAG: CusA/CzcA family heavy metal efflux RND transporter [Phycisphaeraceae bacterium]
MLERILQFSIQHRGLVVLLTIAVAALGVWSLTVLPIDAVPDITNNQVQINTEYSALGPEEIEKQVTFPVETALAGIEGLDYTRSLSRNGFSQVVAVFHDGVDIYYARQQVLERINAARESLPEGADPSMGAITTGLGEVYMWTVEFEPPDKAEIHDGEPGWQSNGDYLTPEGQRLTNEVERAAYLRTVQEWIIAPQLKNVTGVAGVDAIGGYEKQYHVQPDPMKLISYGLTFHNVIEALERNNVATGAGYIEHKGEAYNVRALGLLENAGQIADIVVGERQGTPIYIRDVAAVGIGRELRTGSASENGQEVVIGTTMMLIGANSRTVAAEVDTKMKEINRTMPPSVIAKTVYNRTALVDATIKTVRGNLFEGAILVIVVLFLLLGNIRAALITSLAIPLSMLIAATGMVQGKISGNLMSLGAIDFGLIVDGAVITVENALRRLAQRQHALGRRLELGERLAEVKDAAVEVIKPAAYGQAIIITVYLPILFLTGVEGKMFRPMAITVIFALVGAFVLSITFIPAMIALGIRGKVREKENFLIRWAKAAYAPLLRWAVRFRYPVVAAAIALFAASAWLFTTLGSEFVPKLDEGDIAMHAMRIPSTGITQSTDMQFDVEKAVSQVPEVALVYSKTGTAEMAADPMPPNVSDTFIILKPKEQWRSPEELDAAIAELEDRSIAAQAHDDPGDEEGGKDEHAADATTHKGRLVKLIQLIVEELPGNNYEFTQPIEMRFNELISGVRSDVAVKVYGDDFQMLIDTANLVAAALADVPGTADLKIEQAEGLPVMEVKINRGAIARYGLNVADVQEVLAIAVGGRQAGLVFEGDRRFDLLVRLPDELRGKIENLRDLYIPLPPHEADNESEGLAVASLAAGPGAQWGAWDRPGFIPLGTVADIHITEGPNQISRENGKRRLVVGANVRGRDLGSYVAQAQQHIADRVSIPAGYWLDWGGQFENLVAARRRLAIVVPVCFFLIFLLLFGTFGNVKHALLVFTGVPLAMTGGVLALWLRGMPFSISAAVGFIALSGVAVLNGLVMITFINQLRHQGADLEDAIFRGALTRLRPVLMTALVASLGFVPMALSTGRGAEVQQPLATVVIGGLITSTALTLVVLPALYRLFEGKNQPL